jgi:23S rRNA (uracil1939-C5)-methyltransferase
MRSPPVAIVDATVTSLAPGGDGVAHAELGGERRAIFVPRSAPGDRAKLEVDLSRRPARGRLLELVAAGKDRVTPPCAFSTRCGGCDWMHLSPDAQAREHRDHVRAALPPAWRDVPIRTLAAPQSDTGDGSVRYRTRARVHARSERRGRVSVGMHESGTHDPVEVDTCVVLEPGLDRARAALSPLLQGSTGRGEVQLGLGVGRRPVLDIRWTGTLAPSVFAELEASTGRGDLAGARLVLDGATKPATIGDPTPWTTGADGLPLRLAPGGFAQASEAANAELARHVAERVRERKGAASAHTAELYAGSGNLSVLLAREVGELVCVEADRDACDAARANLATRGLAARARVVEGDAAEYVWASGTKVVVLDPPRIGARQVAERLVDVRVATVVYVSCDPQTLGRDLAILAATYDPASVATFEMFPQTSHVETVVVLERRRR